MGGTCAPRDIMSIKRPNSMRSASHARLHKNVIEQEVKDYLFFSSQLGSLHVTVPGTPCLSGRSDEQVWQ